MLPLDGVCTCPFPCHELPDGRVANILRATAHHREHVKEEGVSLHHHLGDLQRLQDLQTSHQASLGAGVYTHC